jgi:hypothetical protein
LSLVSPTERCDVGVLLGAHAVAARSRRRCRSA